MTTRKDPDAPPPPKCSATRTNGQRCSRFPIRGGTVCATHGGQLANVKRAASENTLQQRASRGLRQLGTPSPIEDPLTALMEHAGRARAWLDECDARVAELREWRFLDSRGAEQLRSELILRERAAQQLTEVLAVTGRLNVEERLARVEEKHAKVIIDCMNVVFSTLKLYGDDQIPAKKAVVRYLRHITAPGTVVDADAPPPPELPA